MTDYYLTALISEICAPLSATVEPRRRPWAHIGYSTADPDLLSRGRQAAVSKRKRETKERQAVADMHALGATNKDISAALAPPIAWGR